MSISYIRGFLLEFVLVSFDFCKISQESWQRRTQQLSFSYDLHESLTQSPNFPILGAIFLDLLSSFSSKIGRLKRHLLRNHGFV